MTSTLDRPAPADGGGAGRPLTSRWSTGHVLLAVAALVAGLANYAVLRSMDDTVDVVVAARELVPGVAVTVDDLATSRVGLDRASDVGLVPAAELEDLVGAVPSVDVPGGAALRSGDLRPAAALDGLRRMSVPVDRDRAVAGAVAVGDRVDVLATVEGRSAYLLGDVSVLGVAGTDAGPLGQAAADFSLTVAVDADQARCLATALATARLTVVLSTGTEPVVADGCTLVESAGTGTAGGAEADE